MGILQARILEWVAMPPPGDLPNPGMELKATALQADFFFFFFYSLNQKVLGCLHQMLESLVLT